MNDSDKVLKVLETIQKDISDLKQGQTETNERLEGLETAQARTSTALDALAEGQKDIREQMVTKEELQADIKSLKSEMATKEDIKKIRTEMATTEDIKRVRSEMATKADIMDLRSDLSKRVKGHGRRINTLEDELDIPHPHKN